MPQKRRFQQPNKRQQASRPPSDTRRSSLASIIPSEPVAPTVYGKAFIVAEDAQKNTFYFHGGAWVAYPESIAQIKLTCLVKELPQKLNNMTRYEVRVPE
jgi:acetyl esterase/lipase